MKRIRLLLVDDQPAIRLGLRMRLGLEPDMEVIGEASDGAQALLASHAQAPDVILMDVEMPVLDGLSATRQLVSQALAPKVIVLTIHDSAAMRAAARAAGAFAFIAKHEPGDRLIEIIRLAATEPEEEDTS